LLSQVECSRGERDRLDFAIGGEDPPDALAECPSLAVPARLWDLEQSLEMKLRIDRIDGDADEGPAARVEGLDVVEGVLAVRPDLLVPEQPLHLPFLDLDRVDVMGPRREVG